MQLICLFALAKDDNTTGDMVFDVRENNGSSFGTTSNKAFVFAHYASEIGSATRAGAWTFLAIIGRTATPSTGQIGEIIEASISAESHKF